MEFRVLPADAAERQQLAQWYHAQWGRDAGLTLEQELQRLDPPQDAEGFPHLIAAFEDGQVVGAVQLKRREMQAFPQYEYWLGSVFVADSHRGRGLASGLVEQAAAQAAKPKVQPQLQVNAPLQPGWESTPIGQLIRTAYPTLRHQGVGGDGTAT